MTATISAERLASLRELGLTWRQAGQVSLRGPIARLAQDIDGAFVRLATAIWRAEQEWHPASLPADRLQRVDYLHSFPHQATFPLRLVPDEANLDAFRAGGMVNADGEVALTELAPTREVLTPAACYHLYTNHEGETLDAPRYLTTRNTCFRQEVEYVPLRRQWSFTMREIVCIGSASEAANFLETARFALDLLLKQADVPVAWESATDPFFRPMENPKYLIQKLQPTKYEAIFGGDLAIGSANLHHEHFGEAFSITREGDAARTACIAFGIDRWLFAVTERHGTDPAGWPDFAAAAEQVATSVPTERS